MTIPDSVMSIGCAAFSMRGSLTELDLGSGVTTIGDRAFERCFDLESVVLPERLMQIGDKAFYGCSITCSVTLGSFAEQWCVTNAMKYRYAQ